MSETIYTIPCGGSVTLPANMPATVTVTCAGGVAGPVAGAESPAGSIFMPPPEWGALSLRIVPQPFEVRAGGSIEDAVRAQITGLEGIPEGSTVVIGAREGDLDAEEVGRVAGEISGLGASNVEVRILGADE